MLLQEESQRVPSHLSGINSRNVAMSVKSVRPITYPDSKRSGKSGTTQGQRNPNDPSLYCDYCHFNGHIRDTCFYLHGYPAWHKFYEKPKPKPKGVSKPLSAQVSNTQEVVVGDSTNAFSIEDTQSQCDAQYKHLLQMLQSGLKTGSTESRHNQWSASANSVNAGQFNPGYFAGTFHSRNTFLLPITSDHS